MFGKDEKNPAELVGGMMAEEMIKRKRKETRNQFQDNSCKRQNTTQTDSFTSPQVDEKSQIETKRTGRQESMTLSLNVGRAELLSLIELCDIKAYDFLSYRFSDFLK